MIFICMLLVCSSCSKPVPQELPADWPIPELTLPEGSVITRPVAQIHEMPVTLPGRSWMVFFDNPGTFAEVAAEIESGLAQAGYGMILAGSAPFDSEVTLRWYYSPDGKIEVVLDKGGQTTAEKKKNLASDFRLSIMENDEPSPMLKAVDMGKARWVELH